MKQGARVVITGGTGLVGRRLTPMLIERGYDVVVVGRGGGAPVAGARTMGWDEAWWEGADAVVHLAGATVAQRWTAKHRAAIAGSRVDRTRAVVAGLKAAGGDKVLVSASATGFYRSQEEVSSEASARGSGFLSDVVRDWEAEASKAQADGHRVVMLRTGLVLAREGGVLGTLGPVFKAGLGSALGTGRHWQSWIHIDDLCALYLKALEDVQMEGVYNAVAPEPVRQRDFARALAKALHRPFWLPATPAGVLRLVLGDMAQMLLDSHRILPERTLAAGFQFRFPHLEDALRNLLDR